jgi:hypothetical protein
MGVGPDGACGGMIGAGDSWSHSTATTTRTWTSDTEVKSLRMAGGSYHAAAVTVYHASEEPDIEVFEPRRIDEICAGQAA